MQRLKLLKRCPAVPRGTRSPQGVTTDSSGWWDHLGLDAAATLKVHPQVIYLGAVSLCLLGGCRREQTLLWAAVSQCPQPRDPHGEGVRTWCRSSCLTGRLSSQQRTHSSSLSPQTQHRHKPQRFQAGTRRGKASAQALPPRAASAKDLTGIRLELHQVSALSPQLQAGMSFTPSDSLFQVGTFNTQRGIATRDRGQQQPWSPFLGPLPILPSPFPSRPLFTLEPFPGVVVCPQETFHTAGRDLPDSQTASWVHQPSVDASSLHLSFELLGAALPSLVQS